MCHFIFETERATNAKRGTEAEDDDEVSFTIGDHESLVSAERLERRRASRTVNAAAAVPPERPDLEENKENLCDVILEFPKRYVCHCLVTYHLLKFHMFSL